MNIINERPDTMSFESYRDYLKQQKQWIRFRKKGLLYYVASEIVYFTDELAQGLGYTRTHPPFVGDTRNLQYPIGYDQN